jgi:hypothetical protein
MTHACTTSTCSTLQPPLHFSPARSPHRGQPHASRRGKHRSLHAAPVGLDGGPQSLWQRVRSIGRHAFRKWRAWRQASRERAAQDALFLGLAHLDEATMRDIGLLEGMDCSARTLPRHSHEPGVW